MNPRETGFLIGQALEARQYSKARSILDNAVSSMQVMETQRDYSVPLSQVCTNARIVNLFERAGATTVEQFYRTNPADFLAEAEEQFASKKRLAEQSQIVESRYSKRLHGNMLPAAVRRLLNANVLNMYDCGKLTEVRLNNIFLGSPLLARQVRLIVREHLDD